jgi:hypothetical protein
MASSFTRLLDHTQRRATVDRTALDEWSAPRRDLNLTTQTHTTDKHPCPRWDSNLRLQQASGLRLRMRGHWDRPCTVTSHWTFSNHTFIYLWTDIYENLVVKSVGLNLFSLLGSSSWSSVDASSFGYVQCICVFCVDLRTNGDYFSIQY